MAAYLLGPIKLILSRVTLLCRIRQISHVWERFAGKHGPLRVISRRLICLTLTVGTIRTVRNWAAENVNRNVQVPLPISMINLLVRWVTLRSVRVEMKLPLVRNLVSMRLSS